MILDVLSAILLAALRASPENLHLLVLLVCTFVWCISYLFCFVFGVAAILFLRHGRDPGWSERKATALLALPPLSLCLSTSFQVLGLSQLDVVTITLSAVCVLSHLQAAAIFYELQSGVIRRLLRLD